MSSSSTTAQGPPSSGYYLTSSLQSNSFTQYFANLWGPQHQRFDDQGSLTIWLDSTSGSGFKSLRSYRSGYFGVAVKLQSGYTAGVLTSFYVSIIVVDNDNHSIQIFSRQRTDSKVYKKERRHFPNKTNVGLRFDMGCFLVGDREWEIQGGLSLPAVRSQVPGLQNKRLHGGGGVLQARLRGTEAKSNTERWRGCRGITWCMIIAMIQRETTRRFLNAKTP
ncbi:putative xyloglucan endotransglucosylase/hydrolase protein 32, partial [Cucurbita argyrosperma subsp. argyrosperma]